LSRWDLEVTLYSRVLTVGQGGGGVFEIDHASDVTAPDGKFKLFLCELNRYGKPLLLTGRRVEPIDKLHRGKNFRSFVVRYVRNLQLIDRANLHAGQDRAFMRLIESTVHVDRHVHTIRDLDLNRLEVAS